MATTRAAVLRENRVRRREFTHAKGDENVKPRSTTNSKHERANANFPKDEHTFKSYSKIGSPPKKHLQSDLNLINTRKNSASASPQEKEPANKVEVSRKNSDQESKRLSVSKLKNIFDSLDNEGQPLSKPALKPRPKSAVKIPKDPKSEPTINRWSVPTYVNNASSQGSQNYKIYVTEGIAAKRAKFEDSSSESIPVSLKGSGPKLADLVPELGPDGMRSRTRSDPGFKPSKHTKKPYKQRSYSDTGSTQNEMLLFDKKHSFDDISIGKERSFKRLSKSSSVDVLDVSEDDQRPSHQNQVIKEEPQQLLEYQESTTLECTPDQTFHENGDSSKKERIDSGISSSVESSAENSEEMLKAEEEEELHSVPLSKSFNTKKEEKYDHTYQHHSEKRVRDESLVYGRPGEVREANWIDEPAPKEEKEDTKTPIFVTPEIKTKRNDKKQEYSQVQSHGVHKHEVQRNEVEESNGVDEKQTDDVESSEDESSVVEHSSPEIDSHIAKEPFAFDHVQLVSSFANKEKKKASRNVIFAKAEPKKWFTYSAEEYIRGNEEVDPVTASAEWELEKRVEKMDVYSVDLGKDERGLGLSIIGLGVGTDSGVEKLGIFIKSLTPGGTAEKDGRIQVNDQIIEVDGVSLVGVTQIFAAQTLKNTSGTVRFLMGREKGKQHIIKPASSPDVQQSSKEFEELKTKLAKTEIRADRAEAKLRQMEAKLEAFKTSMDSNFNKDSRTANLEESLAEVTEKLKSTETEVAIAEAENADMLHQLEESKGMYLLLEKRYNALKTKNKEYEEKIEREKKSSESRNDSYVTALQNRIKELEQEVKLLKSPNSKSSTTSGKTGFTGSPLSNGTSTTKGAQERYFSLEAEKFERLAAAQTESITLDLDIIPVTKPLNNDLNLDKKRVAEAQGKSHKPTRASWGCLDEDLDLFKNGELDYNEDDEEENTKVEYKQERPERPKQFGQGFALPGFPAGGFKLKPTGRSLMDNSPNEPESAAQQELRSSYPLAVKDKTQTQVVENLLEQQLSRTNHNKVASLPSAIDQEEGKPSRRKVDSDDCMGSSANSLDEIEEATRRIDSDLTSSQGSSRGPSPFLPPAMPLLKMKTVPVSESYNESLADAPPDVSTDSESDNNIPSPVSFSPTSDGPSVGSGSCRLSNAWLSRPVQEWDIQQVGMWLTGLELEEYVIEFSNKDIDGRQLLNLDTSKMKSMGINQNSRAILKKRIKELKYQTEREGKTKKQKEPKPIKKDNSPTTLQDTFGKLGLIKKGKYTVN